jgi:hypothetical protein
MRGEFDSQSNERRSIDRRKRRVSMVLHERRTGFDRRGTVPGGAIAAGYDGVLRGLRDSPSHLGIILVTINLLNVVDFLLTLNALAMGAAEANPVMKSLFNVDPLYAGIFKFIAIFAVTLVMWRCRRYRSALQAALLVLAVFTLVFFYHIVGITLLS